MHNDKAMEAWHLKTKIKDQDLQISKLKDDVQYWMKRANANGYRALDRRSDK